MEDRGEIVRAEPSAFDAGALLQAIVEKGITPESVAIAKDLMAMKREMDRDAARLAFNAAFVALQRDLAPVKAVREIPDNKGGVRSVFAAYEDIRKQVDPILFRHGFGVGFEQGESTDTHMSAIVILTHQGGHEDRSAPFRVRVGKGAPGNSDTQNDGGAFTFAKRYALCNRLGIVIDKDGDARVDGEYITEDEAKDMERRVRAIRDDAGVRKFLALADANTFGEITRSKYNVVLSALIGAEKKAAEAKAQPVPAVESAARPADADVPPELKPCPADPLEWLSGIEVMAQRQGMTPSQLGASLASFCEKNKTDKPESAPEASRRVLWNYFASGKAAAQVKKIAGTAKENA